MFFERTGYNKVNFYPDMKKFFTTTVFVALLLFIPVLTEAQTVTPSPVGEELINKSISSTPVEVVFSGRNKANLSSSEITFDLLEIPATAKLLDTEFSFLQQGASSGILKIVNKQTGSLIDSMALGQQGVRTSTRLDTTVENWVKDPKQNSGLILQIMDMEADAELKLSSITLNVEYIVPDKTSPEILKLELKVVDQNKININWETNEPVVVMAEFGKTSNYDRKTETSAEYKNKDMLEITELSTNITYHLQFSAFDASGNSTKSTDIVFTTNDNTVTNSIPVAAGVLPPRLLNHELTSEGMVDLAWSESESEFISGYIIYRNSGDGPYNELARLDKSVRRYSDSRIEFGVTYSYYVVAYAGIEQSSRSPVISVTIPGNNRVMGLGDFFGEESSGLAVFFIAAGLLIIMSMAYFVRKKILSNIAYNEKLSRHSRIHNTLHDPDYYINGYEDAVMDKKQY